MNRKLVKQIRKSFKKNFKSDCILVCSPGRINLIGEHTDYNDGFAFPAAINKGIVLAIGKTNSNKSNALALDLNETHELNLNQQIPIDGGGWRNYLIGVIAEIQQKGLTIGNFNCVFAGNIPSGSGMSSSAALENSFVFGLNELFELDLSKMEMALISQRSEHYYAGVKCGIMDQFASMFGIANRALLLDCRTLKAEAFELKLKAYKLILINTNVKHELSESAYNERRTVCEQVAKSLGKNALRDVSFEELEGLKEKINTDSYMKALYVLEENNRVLEFSKAILEDNLKVLGQLLYQSHAGLRNKYNVSCPELDFLVDVAKTKDYILGARMMGGGFGGCTINLIKKDKYKTFKKEITKKYKKQFGGECSFYSVKLSEGTHLCRK